MARDEVLQDARGPTSWVGRRLGPYRIQAEIARGGMAVVLAAVAIEGPAAGATVALKVVHGAQPLSSWRAVVREARVMSALDHPNVVRALDAGEVDGVLYLAMELVVGVTWARLLARVAERGGRTDPWVAAWIVARAARGLHAAHELRDADGTPLDLVHRDVSPQNVLLDFDGRVLVADFGVAKVLHDATTTGQGMLDGKLGYMSPEQVRGGELDRRGDVFALGAILYEGLTGERPFDGSDPAEVIARTLQGPPRDPHAVRADLSPELARMAMRCLANDPGDWPATAREVADELHEALRSECPDAPERLAAALAGAFPEERDRLEALRGVAALAFAPTAPGVSSVHDIDDETTHANERAALETSTLASPTGDTTRRMVAPPPPVEVAVVAPRLSIASVAILVVAIVVAGVAVVAVVAIVLGRG